MTTESATMGRNSSTSSSGKQIGASEQPLHRDESTSGGGNTPASSAARSSRTAERVRSMSASVIGTATRRRDFANRGSVPSARTA